MSTRKPRATKKKETQKEKEVEQKPEEKEPEEGQKIPTKPLTPRPLTKMEEIKSEDLVEEELKHLQYILKDRVMVKDPTVAEKMGCAYIKAVNKNGQTIFIELDTPGFVTVEAGSLVTIEEKQADMVPYTSKMSESECIASDVCGVAFECRDGICTLTRTDSSTLPEERNFIIADKAHICSRTAMFENSPISYPIVKMSEIRHDPELVLRLVDMCTKRLRNVAYKNSMEELQKTFAIQQEFVKNFAEFYEFHQSYYQILRKKIETLERYNQQYNTCTTLSEQDKKNRYLVQVNLRNANEMVVDLLNLSHVFNAKREIIVGLVEDLRGIKQFMKERFEKINDIVNE